MSPTLTVRRPRVGTERDRGSGRAADRPGGRGNDSGGGRPRVDLPIRVLDRERVAPGNRQVDPEWSRQLTARLARSARGARPGFGINQELARDDRSVDRPSILGGELVDPPAPTPGSGRIHGDEPGLCCAIFTIQSVGSGRSAVDVLPGSVAQADPVPGRRSEFSSGQSRRGRGEVRPRGTRCRASALGSHPVTGVAGSDVARTGTSAVVTAGGDPVSGGARSDRRTGVSPRSSGRSDPRYGGARARWSRRPRRRPAAPSR